MTTRKEFLGHSAAAFFAAALPAAFAATAPQGTRMKGNRRLRFGVVSDIHVNGGKTCDAETLAKAVQPLEKALRWFDAQGVDAVLIPGDLADMARVPELKAIAETWWKVFPDGKGADGRRVEELFLFGNHDTWAHLTKEITPIWPNRAKVWEELFHEPYADVRVKTVKGYDFILAGWAYGFADFEREVKAAGAKGRIFFAAQHPHPNGTCHGKYAWGRDNGASTKLLSAYPKAVMFSGHSHYVFSDERTVWQGGFTSIGAGSLRYSEAPYDDYPPVGAENTDVASNVAGNIPFAPGVAKAINDAKIMGANADLPLGRGQQGLLVDLYDDGLVVRRHEFVFGADLGPDWEVPLPARAGGPFDPAVREKATAVCEFATGASLTLKPATGVTRDGIAHEILNVTVPAGAATTGAPLVGYDVGYLRGGKFTHLQYVVACDFNLPPAEKRKTMTFPVRKDRLPSGAQLAVSPVDCFVRRGKSMTI